MKFLKLNINLIIILILTINFISCNNSDTSNIDTSPKPYSEVKKEHKEELTELNKNLVKIDYEVINRYIDRHKWKMNSSETGLFYQIYHNTKGRKAEDNLEAVFAYNISMLDGSPIYSSKEDGLRSLILGHNQEERGLNEGLLMMKVGEKARFILPPHLAFGVPGDGYRVPYYTTLLYEIELIELKDIN